MAEVRYGHAQFSTLDVTGEDLLTLIARRTRPKGEMCCSDEGNANGSDPSSR